MPQNVCVCVCVCVCGFRMTLGKKKERKEGRKKTERGNSVDRGNRVVFITEK